MRTVGASRERAEWSVTRPVGSGAKFGIQQETVTEVGRKWTGADFDWQGRQKERADTGDDTTEGCRVGLPLVEGSYPVGLHMATGGE